MTDYSDVRDAYDTVAADYADHFPDASAESPLDRAMVDAFAAAVHAGQGEAGREGVLDAGCGAGRMSAHLAARGLAVCGVDLSPGMVTMVRRDHPELQAAGASIDRLPFPDGRFAGVLLWYSVIHTPPEGLGVVLAETVRVLRPGGHLLVGFQAGRGVRDVAPAYRRFGHEVRLERHLHDPDDVARRLGALGVPEVARMVRRPRPGERDDQAALLARRLGVPDRASVD